MENVTKQIMVPLFYFTLEVFKLLLKFEHSFTIWRREVDQFQIYQIDKIRMCHPKSLEVKRPAGSIPSRDHWREIG